MTINVQIVGPNGEPALVNNSGELATGRVEGDLSSFNELAAADTAYNFYKPLAGLGFIITGFEMKANQSVSNVAEATVIIYEASEEDTTTVDKILYQTAMLRDDRVPIAPVKIGVNPGKFINAKTDDDDIFVNILGYYADIAIPHIRGSQ